MKTLAWLNTKYNTLHHADGVIDCADVSELKPLVLAADLEREEGIAILHAEIARLRETIEFAAHKLEGGRVWGGMAWSMSPLHPTHYQPALERLRAALGPNVGAKLETTAPARN